MREDGCITDWNFLCPSFSYIPAENLHKFQLMNGVQEMNQYLIGCYLLYIVDMLAFVFWIFYDANILHLSCNNFGHHDYFIIFLLSCIISTFEVSPWHVGPAEKNAVSCGFWIKVFKAFWISHFFQSAPNKYSSILCFDLLGLLCQISNHLKSVQGWTSVYSKRC